MGGKFVHVLKGERGERGRRETPSAPIGLLLEREVGGGVDGWMEVVEGGGRIKRLKNG